MSWREIDFPERGTAEWDAAWTCLGRELLARGLGGGHDLAQEHQYQVWQLMDVCTDPDGSRWAEFRHRSHPVTHRREYVRVEVTP